MECFSLLWAYLYQLIAKSNRKGFLKLSYVGYFILVMEQRSKETKTVTSKSDSTESWKDFQTDKFVGCEHSNELSRIFSNEVLMIVLAVLKQKFLSNNAKNF